MYVAADGGSLLWAMLYSGFLFVLRLRVDLEGIGKSIIAF